MRLPNADRAQVDRVKVVNYLLSTEHQHGRDKAAAFLRFGFSPERWEEFAEALRAHGPVHDISPRAGVAVWQAVRRRRYTDLA